MKKKHTRRLGGTEHTPGRAVKTVMADHARSRALLGIPLDAFAAWHDPHAEVRGTTTPRLSPKLQLDLAGFSPSSADTSSPLPRTWRTGAWPRRTASSRSCR